MLHTLNPLFKGCQGLVSPDSHAPCILFYLPSSPWSSDRWDGISSRGVCADRALVVHAGCMASVGAWACGGTCHPSTQLVSIGPRPQCCGSSMGVSAFSIGCMYYDLSDGVPKS